MKRLSVILAGLLVITQTTDAGILPVPQSKTRVRTWVSVVEKTSRGSKAKAWMVNNYEVHHVFNVTKPNVPAPGGMEVNSFTGNLLHRRYDEYAKATGFRGIPLEVTFSYNSGLSKNDWGMGKGWTSSFNMMYEVIPGYVIIRGEDGRKDSFAVSGSVYTPPVGVFNNLSEYAPGKYMIRSKSGHKMLFDDASHKKVTSIEDPNGNKILFTEFNGTNQPGLILGITATNVHHTSIRLGWSSGRLAYILDSVASPPRMTTYQYDARGNLKLVTGPMGHVYKYRYDARSRMTGFTDELSHSVAVSYSSSGAVSSVTTPGSPDTPPTERSFSYDPPSRKTWIVDHIDGALQTIAYTFDTQNRLVQVQGPHGLDEQYQYDSQNNITQTTNSNGQIHAFTWDTKGNMLSVTDPLAQTASWTYEPLYNQVTSFTDKKGNITGFLQDAFSNPIEISRPLGVTESFTYDINGNLTSATDGRGNTCTYTYNANGYLTGISRPIGSQSFSYDNSGNLSGWVDADGDAEGYSYDALNRIVSMTNALGGTRLYLYGGMDNLIQETDENGHSTSYTYDALNRLIAVTRPEGITILTRDEYGNIQTSADFKGNLTTYDYDERNRLTSITDPLGHSSSVTYDNNSNVMTQTDFNGNTTSFTHDMLNRMVQVTDALGHSTSMVYDPNDNMVTVTDANSHTTTYTYDALDRTTQVNHPIGSETFVYDNNNNLLSATDPNGHTTTYLYDALDRPITVTDPLLHATSFAWSLEADLLSMTDANGLTSSYTYDALHRMITSTNPMLEVTSCTYDAVGNQASVSLPYGNTHSYTYDASDRIVSMSDALGPVESYTYDANSNRLTATDALGNTTQCLYDGLDRLTQITAPLGQSALYAYDNNSNIISTTDGEGGTTTMTYDALNRQITTTFPGGLTTTVGFDPVGNSTSILDARGNSTVLAYDVMDRLSTITYANGSAIQYTYDPAGNRLSTLDQNASLITYVYDAVDRLISRSYPGGSSDDYTYDNAGRMITANNSAAAITLSYDAAGRVLSEVLNGKTTAHSYNTPGRTVTTTYPGGEAVQRSFTPRLNTATVVQGVTVRAAYTYDPASRPTALDFDNGVASTYAYNNNSWATSVSHNKGPVQLAGFNYTFDNRGFRTTVEKPHRPTNSEEYQYDATTRLTGYKEGTLLGGHIPAPLTQTQFTFDPVGNRTNSTKDGVPTTYLANNINAYTSISGSLPLTPTYDANGNMTSDGLRVFTYDYMDRLTGVLDLATNAAYSYDALGRRIQKVVNGATAKYFYDGSDVIEERDGADAVTASFIVGNDAPVVATVQVGSLPPQDYFYHYNSLGSPVAITNNTGNVIEEYEYDAFGNPSIYDSAHVPISVSLIGNIYLFGGMEYDAESGLYYDHARHYTPSLGRFMQQDPASLMGDVPDLRNGYSYVGNNPTNFVDPSGEMKTGTVKFFNEAKGFGFTRAQSGDQAEGANTDIVCGILAGAVRPMFIDIKGVAGRSKQSEAKSNSKAMFTAQRMSGGGGTGDGPPLGILAGVAVPKFIDVTRPAGRSKQSEAKSNSKAMFTAQRAFNGDDWGVGDWAIYNGTQWEKVDNSDLDIQNAVGFNGGNGVEVRSPSSRRGGIALFDNSNDGVRTQLKDKFQNGDIPDGQNFAKVPRTVLKEYFQTGDKPTQGQFSNFIDSGLNLIDDGRVWPQPGYWSPAESDARLKVWQLMQGQNGAYVSKIPAGFVAKKNNGQLAGKK